MRHSHRIITEPHSQAGVARLVELHYAPTHQEHSDLFSCMMVGLQIPLWNAVGNWCRDEDVGISKSLFAWWKLNEKIGYLVADSSGNKATGLVKHAGSQLAHTTDGIVFDGATYIFMGTTPSLSGQTDFAVHAWVKVPPRMK
ncbi:hypothetical protein SELMODRAFT_412720 [Selaginella moellendorffii]|uniref:Uncharacterized protein n=1 Tax=Selaginella moellendorffii TaxID=88036 RepID=D8RL95_SELML|nr:hypothetical protein SELMODRAFT_412720 [Selaginella moellendorffii]